MSCNINISTSLSSQYLAWLTLQAQHNITHWSQGMSHLTWTLREVGGYATVLADYALTTTAKVASVVLSQMASAERFTSLASLTFWPAMEWKSARRRLPRQWSTARPPKYPPYVRTSMLADSSSLSIKSPNEWADEPTNNDVLLLAIVVVVVVIMVSAESVS